MARKITPLPPLERLQELFAYNARSGLLTWRSNQGRAVAGQPAGWLNKKGYVYVGVDGRSYKLHRLAWYLHYGVPPTDLIDHIDRNPANNKIRNLRECTHAQNQQNKKTYANNLSGVKGVSWYPNRKAWRVRIQHLGKPILVGMYKSFEEACAARKVAQRQLHTRANSF